MLRHGWGWTDIAATAAVLALAAFLVLAGSGCPGKPMAPDFELKDLKGRTVILSELRG